MRRFRTFMLALAIALFATVGGAAVVSAHGTHGARLTTFGSCGLFSETHLRHLIPQTVAKAHEAYQDELLYGINDPRTVTATQTFQMSYGAILHDCGGNQFLDYAQSHSSPAVYAWILAHI